MSKRPTSSITSLSPSYTTKREPLIFKECAPVMPWVLRKANMKSNTLQSLPYFFSAERVSLANTEMIPLWKKMQSLRNIIQRRNFRYSTALPAEGRRKRPPDTETVWMAEPHLEHFVYAALRAAGFQTVEKESFNDVSLSAEKKNKLKSPVPFPVWYKLIQMAYLK